MHGLRGMGLEVEGEGEKEKVLSPLRCSLCPFPQERLHFNVVQRIPNS